MTSVLNNNTKLT